LKSGELAAGKDFSERGLRRCHFLYRVLIVLACIPDEVW
jgi:hypothetical protein